MALDLEKNMIPHIELKEISKHFKAVIANDHVNMKVEKGTIHGVIGENGAGKSTTMKILYGLYKPDGGEILLNGKSVHWKTPRDAIRHGIGMVHQHFMLAKPYSALDNIILGDEPARFFGDTWLLDCFDIIHRQRAKNKLEKIMEETGLYVDLKMPIERLPVGIQQRVEILKLLYRDAQTLILDEPTAVLTPQEVDELFQTLLKMKENGKTILIITHKLREVLAFTNNITVFRQGRVTGNLPTKEATQESLAELMVGRKVMLKIDVPRLEPQIRKPVLHIDQVTVYDKHGGAKPKLNKINMSIASHEIVGIAGVEGNGQSELLQLVCHPLETLKTGDHFYGSGKLSILGKEATHKNIAEIKSWNVGIVSEDRQKDAILMDSPLDENFLLGFYNDPRYVKHGIIQYKALRRDTLQTIQNFDVRPQAVWNRCGGLSGGNQQKFVIGREFWRQPEFMVVAHPTRGVDVGAIEFIHTKLVEARNKGVGILLVSSELDEIISLSDRILVMYDGSIVKEFKRDEADESKIGFYMGGGKDSYEGGHV